MKIIYQASLASLILLSLNTQAAVFPEYRHGSQEQFSGLPPIYFDEAQTIDGIDYDRKHNYFSDKVGICTDTTNRKVAGKLLGDGFCYVEWKGKIHANSEYYYLAGDTSTISDWKPLYPNFKLDGSEITKGGRDAGEYVYHCLIESKYNSNRVLPLKTLGKFIPNKNRCYFGEGVKRKTAEIGSSDYNLYVLYDRFYTPSPVEPIDPPSYCDNRPKPCFEP